MNLLKRYPLLVTFPLGLFVGAILGCIYARYEIPLIVEEARKVNPNDPLDLIWISYFSFPLIGAALGSIIGIAAAIIIYFRYRKQVEA